MQQPFEGGSLLIQDMSLEQLSTPNELSEVIAESFGANATYVESLLARWRSDPSLVDESWRSYFEELLGENGASVSSLSASATTQQKNDGGAAAAQKREIQRDGQDVGKDDGAGVAPA